MSISGIEPDTRTRAEGLDEERHSRRRVLRAVRSSFRGNGRSLKNQNFKRIHPSGKVRGNILFLTGSLAPGSLSYRVLAKVHNSSPPLVSQPHASQHGPAPSVTAEFR